VVGLEGMDARRLDAGSIEKPVGAVVADVSFISLTKALRAALNLAAPGAWLGALVKPWGGPVLPASR
jgi:23S rRNA (cytidine1920-2'-O)/16S rRNA (cytidine1409-2'-O)-methyltransferase